VRRGDLILRHGNRVAGVALGADNTIVAAAYDGLVYYERDGQPRWRIDGGDLLHPAFRADALLVGGDRCVVELDLDTGERRSTITASTTVFSVAVSGSRIAIGGRPRVELWERGERRWTFEAGKATKIFTPPVHAVNFSADGTRLVVVCAKQAIVLDAATGERLYAANVDRFGASSAVFTADDMIATVGTAGTIDIRDPRRKTKTAVRSIAADMKSGALAMSPDRTRLLAGGKGRVGLWDVATGAQLATLEGPQSAVDAVALSRDGTHAAAVGTDNAVFVWQL